MQGATLAPTLLGVDTLRPRVDLFAFALALGLVAWPTIGFIAERNGAAALMCAMCLVGLVVGRIAGVPGRVLLPVAIGIVVVLALIWINSPVGPRKTSAIAHAIGGTLAGWAVVEALRHRIRDWRSVALLALSVVIAVTFAWELGEYAGDRLFGTALNPTKRNSAEDIFFGTVGGLVGITLASSVSFWRRDA
jgi:energy-coupling factor transporter transmembrane protein EcfT